MKLSELKKIVAQQSRLAKKKGVDPEVMFAAQPKFPLECTLEGSVVSTMELETKKDTTHRVYLLESKELGWLPQPIVDAADWGRLPPKRRTN